MKIVQQDNKRIRRARHATVRLLDRLAASIQRGGPSHPRSDELLILLKQWYARLAYLLDEQSARIARRVGWPAFAGVPAAPRPAHQLMGVTLNVKPGSPLYELMMADLLNDPVPTTALERARNTAIASIQTIAKEIDKQINVEQLDRETVARATYALVPENDNGT